MSIEEHTKKCGITCEKCLDTKMLWLERHDTSDGRGRYQLYNCSKCSDSSELGVCDVIEKINNRLIPPLNDDGKERLEILKEEIDAIDLKDENPVWAVRTESVVNFLFDTTEDVIQQSIKKALGNMSNYINVSEFFEKIYNIIDFENSLQRYAEQNGDVCIFVQSEKRLSNSEVIPWYKCCVDPSKITIQLTIAVIKPKNNAAVEECKRLIESYTVKPKSIKENKEKKEEKQKKEKEEEKKENQA